MVDSMKRPFVPMEPTWPTFNSSHLQVVDYEKTTQQLDPTAAPEKQAKVALDSAIANGDIHQLQTVLKQIAEHIPQQTIILMMHAFRSASRCGNSAILHVLLEQTVSFPPHQVFDLMKYALDGAAMQDNPAIMDFLLGFVQKAFHTGYPQQFLELVQHAVNTAGQKGNLGLLKFLMDHTAAAAIPINYMNVFGQAASGGQAEKLLKEAISGGAQYENVILMLLQSAAHLPENNDSCLGSRQSLKNTAKVQLVKTYKQKDPALFAKLMAAVKNYFSEEITPTHSGLDGDIAM